MRIKYEGAHYHIWSKGNRDDYIFHGDGDKEYFVELLSKGQQEYHVEIFAYCVLGNHYHLQIQTPEPNLPEFMHYLGSSYASYLARNDWKGHIFAGRYHSKCVNAEEYMMGLSRYIHLNPVVAHVAKLPEEYCWSSYVYYLQRVKAPSWLNTGWLLDYFGPGVEGAAERYKEFVLAGIQNGNRSPTEGFNKISAIEGAFDGICQLYGIKSLNESGFESPENLKNARRLFIFLAKGYTDSKNKDIADIIGDIGPTAVSNQYQRICAKVREDVQYQRYLYAGLTRLIDEYKLDIAKQPSTKGADPNVEVSGGS